MSTESITFYKVAIIINGLDWFTRIALIVLTWAWSNIIKINQNQDRLRVRFLNDLFDVTYITRVSLSLIKGLCGAVEYIYVNKVAIIINGLDWLTRIALIAFGLTINMTWGWSSIILLSLHRVLLDF